MNTIKVNRHDLLEKLQANRKEHRDLFLKAQEGYRKAVIEELDRMLADARANKPIRRALTLPEPQDHTEDYDREIAMLEMSVDDEIEIHAQEFDMFVMDNWSWKSMVTACNMSYVK